jgi:hypothetical protein
VEENAIARCNAKHSADRDLPHAGGFSRGGARRGSPSSRSTPVTTTFIAGVTFLAEATRPARIVDVEQRTPKTEDSPAEGVEFELSGDVLNGQ